MHYVVETTRVRHLPPRFVTRTVVEGDVVVATCRTAGEALDIKREHPGTRVREVWSDEDYNEASAAEHNRGA